MFSVNNGALGENTNETSSAATTQTPTAAEQGSVFHAQVEMTYTAAPLKPTTNLAFNHAYESNRFGASVATADSTILSSSSLIAEPILRQIQLLAVVRQLDDSMSEHRGSDAVYRSVDYEDVQEAALELLLATAPFEGAHRKLSLADRKAFDQDRECVQESSERKLMDIFANWSFRRARFDD
jgi:hypothetical protein